MKDLKILSYLIRTLYEYLAAMNSSKIVTVIMSVCFCPIVCLSFTCYSVGFKLLLAAQ